MFVCVKTLLRIGLGLAAAIGASLSSMESDGPVTYIGFAVCSSVLLVSQIGRNDRNYSGTNQILIAMVSILIAVCPLRVMELLPGGLVTAVLMKAASFFALRVVNIRAVSRINPV